MVVIICCSHYPLSPCSTTSGNPEFGSDDDPQYLVGPPCSGLVQTPGEVRKGIRGTIVPRNNNQVIPGNLFPQAAIPAHGAGGYIYIYIIMQ